MYTPNFTRKKSNLDATSNNLRWPSCKGLNEPGRIIFLLKLFSTGSALKKSSVVQKNEGVLGKHRTHNSTRQDKLIAWLKWKNSRIKNRATVSTKYTSKIIDFHANLPINNLLELLIFIKFLHAFFWNFRFVNVWLNGCRNSAGICYCLQHGALLKWALSQRESVITKLGAILLRSHNEEWILVFVNYMTLWCSTWSILLLRHNNKP